MNNRLLPCGRSRPSRAAPPNQARLCQWQQQLKDYLTRSQLKYTEQRWKIAETILSTGGHLDAQALVEKVKGTHPGIGAATVYRSIKVLCDASILKESLTDAQGRVVYELFDDDHHDHIICIDCGEIFEFHDEKIEAQQNAIARKLQFQQVRHRHVIYAHCGFGHK